MRGPPTSRLRVPLKLALAAIQHQLGDRAAELNFDSAQETQQAALQPEYEGGYRLSWQGGNEVSAQNQRPEGGRPCFQFGSRVLKGVTDQVSGRPRGVLS